VVLLDEPTRGLDYHAKRRFADVVRELADAGSTVVIATHDVEFVAQVADRVVVMADGDIVADGPTSDIVVSSPAFAPQVAKILAPSEWLTVADVAHALSTNAGITPSETDVGAAPETTHTQTTESSIGQREATT